MKNYIFAKEIYKIYSWNMILFNILMIFGIKEKSIILTHSMLAIATNIHVLLMTGFVVQGHKYNI